MTTRSNEKSQQMLIDLMGYFRFKRGFSLVCSEFDGMDLAVIGNETYIEVEIKISKSDLLRDKKKDKHRSYREPRSLHNYWSAPNKFYYAVPPEMVEYTESFIAELNPKYGIIRVTSTEVFMAKSAKKLHGDKPNNASKNCAVARLSSENIGLRQKLWALKRDMKGSIKNE